MAPNTRSNQNTADPANQESGGETGNSATGNPAISNPATPNQASPPGNTTHPPNPGLMPGFTAVQASSLQAMISSPVIAQIAANNKVLLDQMKEMMGYGPAQQQMTAPVNPRFVNTPTPTPQPQSNQQPNHSQSSPHDEQPPPADDTTTARWRGEELGTFDPTVDDVYTFTDRIH